MKILLFGSTGMLGNYVYKILSNTYNIINITRDKYDIINDSWDKLNNIINNLDKNDIIINCIGIIPQKVNNDFKQYIKINTLFPHKIYEFSNKLNIKFIHITTDCVFDGSKGDYNIFDNHTANDIYGISKSLGEPDNATVIRTSIIGHEIKCKKSFLEWIISNHNNQINGYINHYWNGITCLTLANIIYQIIQYNLFWKGIKHIYSPNTVSKYDLCNYINEIYNLNINIKPYETNFKNMSLIGDNPFKINNIYQQLVEQKNFKYL